MINFLLLVSRQGKTRLTKWYESYAAKEKARIVREITATVLARAPKMCNFVEWRNKKIIYKRYASLFFIVCVDAEDNELITLEMIHLYVEVLDRYFGNVCELDIIFNFHKAYYILDGVGGGDFGDPTCARRWTGARTSSSTSTRRRIKFTACLGRRRRFGGAGHLLAPECGVRFPAEPRRAIAEHGVRLCRGNLRGA